MHLERSASNYNLSSISSTGHAPNEEEEDYKEEDKGPEETQDRKETEESIDSHEREECQDYGKNDRLEQIHF